MALVLENYSEKAILLKGEKTKEYKENIKAIGGSWNSTLKGWIFSKAKEPEVKKLIDQVNSGVVKPISHHSFDVLNNKDVLDVISLQQQKPVKSADNSVSTLTIYKKLLEIEKELLFVKTELSEFKEQIKGQVKKFAEQGEKEDESNVEEEEEEEEEEIIVQPRLMRKK